jgi:hypothetical protein
MVSAVAAPAPSIHLKLFHGRAHSKRGSMEQKHLVERTPERVPLV